MPSFGGFSLMRRDISMIFVDCENEHLLVTNFCLIDLAYMSVLRYFGFHCDFPFDITIEVIGVASFADCRSLSSFEVETIDTRAFRSCPSLRSIYIPVSVDVHGNHCFYRCASLSSFAFGSGSLLNRIGFIKWLFIAKVKLLNICPIDVSGTVLRNRGRSADWNFLVWLPVRILFMRRLGFYIMFFVVDQIYIYNVLMLIMFFVCIRISWSESWHCKFVVYAIFPSLSIDYHTFHQNVMNCLHSLSSFSVWFESLLILILVLANFDI
jgi:hypothetical protein